MKILGIIPARGGSKGIPGKNIMKFEGKPLLEYAIEAGRESEKISELVVNTDDSKIAKVAENLDCNVIIRDTEIAKDHSKVVDTVMESLSFFENRNQYFDAVLLLQPTSPLRTGKDIDNAINILQSNSETDAVVSMVKVEDHHPARMYSIIDGNLVNQMPEFETLNRQELPELYLRNGCIYLVRTAALKKEMSLMPKNKLAYIMDAKWAVNLDTQLDIVILEELIKQWESRKV